MKIRDLRADEIEVRVQSVTKKNEQPTGVIVLLYKNARCDMNILDETFGSLNWRRDHAFIDGKCYCTVSVWDESKSQWVSKQDVGTESNQDAEKGQASDAFKRACFNWGIGRELYTAPFVFIPESKCNIVQNGTDRNGKAIFVCKDNFSVKSIEIKDKVIVGLSIINDKTEEVVYTYGRTTTNGNGTQSNSTARGYTNTTSKTKTSQKGSQNATEPYPTFEDSWTPRTHEEIIKQLCVECGKKYEDCLKWINDTYKVANPNGLPQAVFLEVVEKLKKAVKK